MLGVHLVGVPKGIIRSVDDDVRAIVDIRPAVSSDQASTAVVVADADWWNLWRRAAPRYNAEPRLVGQNGAVFPGEDRVRQTIGDSSNAGGEFRKNGPLMVSNMIVPLTLTGSGMVKS